PVSLKRKSNQTQASTGSLGHPPELRASASRTAAWLVSWFFDNHDPGICYSTAPKFEHVKDVPWKEVRRLRREVGLPDHFTGPSAPELSTWATRAPPGPFSTGSRRSTGSAVRAIFEGWAASPRGRPRRARAARTSFGQAAGSRGHPGGASARGPASAPSA